MVRASVVFVVFVLVAGSLCSARVQVGQRSGAPVGWDEQGKAAGSNAVKFTVLLRQRNLDKLDDLFHAVSDPTSPTYGQHLTKEQVDDLVRADPEAFEALHDWLRPYVQRGSISLQEHADYVKIKTDVDTATALFQVPFLRYSHKKSGKTVIRFSGTASVPSIVGPHVQLVLGLSEFFDSMTHNYVARENRKDNRVKDEIVVVPSVLRQYYNIPTGLKGTNANNLQGIAAFDDYFAPGALTAFDQDQNITASNVTVFGVDCLPDCDEAESDLDIQYITAIGENIQTYFVKQGNQYWILQALQELLTELPQRPLVISISYGWSELQQCEIAQANCNKFGYDSQKYVEATNVEFKKLGVMGTTVTVSDGDDGAASLGGSSGNCPPDTGFYCPVGGCNHTTSLCNSFMVENETDTSICFFPMGIETDACQAAFNDPAFETALEAFFEANAACNVSMEQDLEQLPHFYSACQCGQLKRIQSGGYVISQYTFNQAFGPVFAADYPTSSPYVTSVGATQFVSSGGQQISKEIGCSILTGASITTGGGFSSFQPQLSYQTQAVQAYLSRSDGLPPSFSFNSQMRAYPDVTLVGHNYKIFVSDNGTDKCPCSPAGVDGTSASSPAFAGMISLINDQLLNNGKSPLGFLNPLLYQMYAAQPEAFHDITVGDNHCNRAYCCLYGYKAVTGWDPVSGLGSPDFPTMLNYILKAKGVAV